MATLRIRASAVADLRSILEYSVDAHGFDVALVYMDDLDRAMDRLRDYPEIGEVRADLGTNLRSLPCGTHRIYYRYNASHVSIVRVLHKAMDVRRWLL